MSITEQQESTAPGTIQASDGLQYTQFRLISSIEADNAISYMTRQSGLERRQLAMNNWGFPSIPIPEFRKMSSRVRLAPSNVRNPFLGHPIYWIEPELTARLKGETDEQWSIRMYFMIGKMGYWTDEGWINFLDEKGFDYDVADVEGYHMGSNPEIKTDRDHRYRFLNEGDIQGGMAAVDQAYRAAMERCRDSLLNETRSFIKRQQACLVHGYNIIGGKDGLYDFQNDANSVNGMWTTKLEPVLGDLSMKYNEEMSRDYPDLSSILDRVSKEFNDLQDLIIMMDYITAVIAVPSIRDGGTPTESYSQMISVLGIATSQASKRKIGYNIVAAVNECFTDQRRENSLNDVISKSYGAYMMSWRRMRMALVNYDRVAEGEPPYLSYHELEVDLVNNTAEEVEFEGGSEEEEVFTMADPDRYDEGGRIVRKTVDRSFEAFKDLDEELRREGL